MIRNPKLFGLLLVGFGWGSLLQAEQVVFSEIMYHPRGDLPEYIEIFNQTATPLDMALWKLEDGVDFTFPDFSPSDPEASYFRPFERLLVSPVDPTTLREAYDIPDSVRIFGPWDGSLSNAGERLTLRDKNGVILVQVEYNDRGTWPVAADGAGPSLVLADPFRSLQDSDNWTFSEVLGGTPGVLPVAEPETPIANPEVDLSKGIPLIQYGSTWKYHDQAADLGTAWRDPGFDDRSWASGPGLFGFENSSLPAPGIQTPLADFDQLTYYLRKEFQVSGPIDSAATLIIDQILDDGAVYYLNGGEIGRPGMNGGSVGFNTTSGRTVSNATEESEVIRASARILQEGRNVLAVEVHQTNTGSSDVVFGARLSLSVPSTPSVLINEIYPAGAGEGFVEFFNPGTETINLKDHYLSGDPSDLTRFRLTGDLPVAPGALVSVGFEESQLNAANGVAVYLTAPDGQSVINAINTELAVERRSVGRKPEGSGTWFLFTDPTRNQPNRSQGDLRGILHLNEVHFAEAGSVDWVELHNTGTSALDVQGLFLSGRPDSADRLALSGSIPAGGYASWQTEFPVDDPEDIRIFLRNNSEAVLDAVRLNYPARGNSLQAFPDGSDEWYASATATRNTTNQPERNTNVVINEIMYDPPSDQVAGEFIELYNRGNETVDLSGWRFTDGIDFTFPEGTSLDAGEFLVVAANRAWMESNYGAIPVVGDFRGTLSNTGERVRLTDRWSNTADWVHYQTGGDWPRKTNGDGSSMELRNPWMDNSRSSAWVDSEEGQKSTIRTYSYTDTFRQLNTMGTVSDYKELHFHLVGDGHVVLDNIALKLNGQGANLLENVDQNSPSGRSNQGWLSQGTHWASHVNDRGELHLIADGHGDNKANRVELDATAMRSGEDYEISFRARWVWGTPRLIVQTWDHSIATSIALPIPNDLGTPGRENSGFLPAPAAQVDALHHQPAVPTPTDNVRITARVHSHDPLQEVLLWHRPDNVQGDATWQSKPMYDDGLRGGDEFADDGIFSAEMTEYRSNGQVVQFYVTADAGTGGGSVLPRNGSERPAMYVVDSNSPSGDLRSVRLIMSALDLDVLSDRDNPTGPYGYSFPRLSNHYFNATIIINETEVYYNGEARNSGSPWTRGGNLDRAKFKFPPDHLFRGKEKLTWDNDAANSGQRHHNRIHRYWLYLLGHPVNENEYIQAAINSGGFSLREEVEPVGNDFLDRNFEMGNEGELYRIDDEWWFTDTWDRQNRNADWSYKGTDNPGRYRSEWMKRTREDEDDYSALINFFKTVDRPLFTQATMDRLIDSEAVMLMAAVRGYTDDWDSFSLNRGKNGYFYRRFSDGRFMFFHWDSDLAFRNPGNAFYNGMPGFDRYIEKPYNQRLFRYFLTELVENYCHQSPRIEAWFDAEEAASSLYSVDRGQYHNWFLSRQSQAYAFLGSDRTQAFEVPSAGGTLHTTETELTLEGTAPLRVFEVTVQDHPEATMEWVNIGTWRVHGIRLRKGNNVVSLQARDRNGNLLTESTVNVDKSENSPPLVQLEGDPPSWRVSLEESFIVDTGSSFDPEGGPLTVNWAVDPGDAATWSAPETDRLEASFARPGIFRLTAAVTDPDGQTVEAGRDVAAYAPGDFDPFNEESLHPRWQKEHLRVRDNSLTGAYYSLVEIPGRLVMHVLDDTAHPLQGMGGAPDYPRLTRSLPASGPWAVQTKVRLESQQLADFKTGLCLRINEAGDPVDYTFGYNAGRLLTINRIDAQGTVDSLQSTSYNFAEAKLRIRHHEGALDFEYADEDGQWIPVYTHPLSDAETRAASAGLFLATEAPLSVKVSFDYGLFIDPTHVSGLGESLAVVELMYDPPGGQKFEFIELANLGNTTLDLTGARFMEGIEYTFPSTTLLPAGEYLVVVKDQTAFASRYPTADIRIAAGNYDGWLSNDGEEIVLVDSQGGLVLAFTYGNGNDWPERVHGEGSSLERIDPFASARQPSNWRASREYLGSPAITGIGAVPSVVLNEILTHSDPPFEDAIELFNPTGETVEIGGWYLSDSPAELQKYRIPDGTLIPPGGFIVFYEFQFNAPDSVVPFALSSVRGDEVYLTSTDEAGEVKLFVDHVSFGPAANGVPFGRWPNGSGPILPLLHPTFGSEVQVADPPELIDAFRAGEGAENSSPKVGPIVFSRIMYHPSSEEDSEFVELVNISADPVPLYDPDHPENTWRLEDAVDFVFPTGIDLGPGDRLLVAESDPDLFRTRHALAAEIPIYGPFSGKLDNNGERLALVRPDPPQTLPPDLGLVPYITVEEINYDDAPPWPIEADGFGAALNRINLTAFGDTPSNWSSQEAPPGEDLDMDGLPDQWESDHLLNPEDPTDADLDPDEDGLTSREEFWSGTDPQNPGSALRLEVMAANNSGTRLRFTAMPGQAYAIYYRDTLGSGAWLKLEEIPSSSEEAEDLILNDKPPPGGTSMRFYRLESWRPVP